mgnify:CR=1 FL=1
MQHHLHNKSIFFALNNVRYSPKPGTLNVIRIVPSYLLPSPQVSRPAEIRRLQELEISNPRGRSQYTVSQTYMKSIKHCQPINVSIRETQEVFMNTENKKSQSDPQRYYTLSYGLTLLPQQPNS